MVATFNAKYDKQRINIDWQVSQQINVKRYEVEWRVDATDFKKIAEVAAVDGKSSYQAKHSLPFVGNNYYRLKAIDQDGNFDYSEERVVNVFGNQTILVYPNPAKTEDRFCD